MSYQRTRVQTKDGDVVLSEIQVEFLRFCCMDMPYWQIAEHMGKMPRTIDGYRDEMFDLLEVGSRVGIVLWCFKSGFIKPKDVHLYVYKKKNRRGKKDRRGNTL